MSSRFVITGAPGSGKTVFLTRLKALPRFREFAFIDELARKLLAENPGYRHDKAALHAAIYRQQVAREAELGNKPFITDRGTADAFAFHPETASRVRTTLSREYKRYHSVVQLGTGAVLGEKYYTGDDIRLETLEEALAIEQATKRVWQGHPDYHFIPANPDIEAKFDQFLQIIDACMSHFEESAK